MSKEFGMRLYYLRTNKLECTHRQIAELLGVDRSTYSKYESGDHFPPYSVLKRLKKVFNVSYDELLEPKLSETEIADYKMRTGKEEKGCCNK